MSARKDGKRIAKCLSDEPGAELAPAHGNVVSVICNWLDDGSTARAFCGLEAAVKYEGVRILVGTLQRPQAIGLADQQQEAVPVDECEVVMALAEFGRQIGHKTVGVKSFSHLGELLDIDADEATLAAAVSGMEDQEVLMLYRHDWPWELAFLKVPVAA